jgi:DNA mismatch endonuclease, patch repair protein
MPDNHTPQQRSENMRSVHGKDTAPELFIRSTLHRLGYRFRLHRRMLPGTPDVVFPGRRSVMFVHGCFWHGHKCPRGTPPASNVEFWQRKIAANRQRDHRVQKQLQKDGWRVLTVWACETKNVSSLEQKLFRFLEQSRPPDGKKVSAEWRTS